MGFGTGSQLARAQGWRQEEGQFLNQRMDLQRAQQMQNAYSSKAQADALACRPGKIFNVTERDPRAAPPQRFYMEKPKKKAGQCIIWNQAYMAYEYIPAKVELTDRYDSRPNEVYGYVTCWDIVGKQWKHIPMEDRFRGMGYDMVVLDECGTLTAGDIQGSGLIKIPKPAGEIAEDTFNEWHDELKKEMETWLQKSVPND